jgi:elongation factor 1-beta
MANAVITIKIMPESPEIDLAKLEQECKTVISEFGGDVGKVEKEPVAFGLVSVSLIFVMDETKGTEELEAKLSAVDGVQSASVTDFRRALG